MPDFDSTSARQRPLDSGQPAGPQPWRWLICAGLLMSSAVLVLFISTGALLGHFMADDFAYVSFGRALAPVPFLDSLQLYWLPMPREVGLQFYRPTIGLSYAWDWGWTAWDAYGYRVTNLCLHIGSAWLFLIVTWLLTRSVRMAAVACWLFALSPAHPETLLWISSRVNLLATFFVLLALLAHLRRRSGGSFLWLPVTALATAIALTSKETGIIIAPLLFVQVWFESSLAAKPWSQRLRVALVSTAHVWVLLIPYFALRYHVLGTFGGGYLGEVERSYASLAYAVERFELLRMLVSPVALTQWSVVFKYSLLSLHVFLLVAVALAYWRGRGRERACGQEQGEERAGADEGSQTLSRTLRTTGYQAIAFVVAWLALTMAPIYKAPFTEASLQDSRLLYEPTLPTVLLLTFGLAAIARSGWRRSARVLCALIVVGYPLLLQGNMEPWLQMGRVSRSLDHWARSLSESSSQSYSENAFTDRWVADFPVVVDGAYLFLSQAPPFVMLEVDPTVRARLHGVRSSGFGKLLREGAKRARAGKLDDWDLMRISSIDGQVEREIIDPSFPLLVGDAELRWARASQAHLRVGDRVEGQLFVSVPKGQSDVLTAKLELRLGGELIAESAAADLLGERPVVVTGPLTIPVAGDGEVCELRLILRSKNESGSISLGPLRIGVPRPSR